jgi:hypothetical protein
MGNESKGASVAPSDGGSPPNPTTDALDIRLKVYDRLLASVSALALIIGGCWGLFNYFDTKKKEASAAEEQHRQTADQKERELQLRKHELDLMVFKERKEAYLALCDAACEIVACRDRKEVEERSRAFLKMYYGRAHIIAEADPEVSGKKIAFKNKLMEYLESNNTESPFGYFGSAAFELTKACRKYVDPRGLDYIGIRLAVQ